MAKYLSSNEQWAVYDNREELYPGSVWPTQEEAAARAILVEGQTWSALEEFGYTLRIVSVLPVGDARSVAQPIIEQPCQKISALPENYAKSLPHVPANPSGNLPSMSE